MTLLAEVILRERAQSFLRAMKEKDPAKIAAFFAEDVLAMYPAHI